jgi:hypothetical protein
MFGKSIAGGKRAARRASKIVKHVTTVNVPTFNLPT